MKHIIFMANNAIFLVLLFFDVFILVNIPGKGEFKFSFIWFKFKTSRVCLYYIYIYKTFLFRLFCDGTGILILTSCFIIDLCSTSQS